MKYSGNKKTASAGFRDEGNGGFLSSTGFGPTLFCILLFPTRKNFLPIYLPSPVFILNTQRLIKLHP